MKETKKSPSEHYTKWVRPMRERYAAQGLCLCGCSLDEPKFKRCSYCREKMRKHNKKYRNKIRTLKNAGKPNATMADDDGKRR